MVTKHEIDRQLRAIGAQFRFWGRAEADELENIIVPGEQVEYAINGRYENGFAMLCITDQRVIIIDKKPLYLTVEDVRYDMMSELDFSQRVFDSSITIYTVNKTLRFAALKIGLLRKASAYIQSKVIEIRMGQPPAQSIQNILDDGVSPIHHKITNPYTRMPIVMRRRVSRYSSSYNLERT